MLERDIFLTDTTPPCETDLIRLGHKVDKPTGKSRVHNGQLHTCHAATAYFPAMAMSVDAKLLKQTRFPPQFNQKVDMKKVNVEVMKKLVGTKVLEKVHWLTINHFKVDCREDF